MNLFDEVLADTDQINEKRQKAKSEDRHKAFLADRYASTISDPEPIEKRALDALHDFSEKIRDSDPQSAAHALLRFRFIAEAFHFSLTETRSFGILCDHGAYPKIAKYLETHPQPHRHAGWGFPKTIFFTHRDIAVEATFKGAFNGIEGLPSFCIRSPSGQKKFFTSTGYRSCLSFKIFGQTPEDPNDYFSEKKPYLENFAKFLTCLTHETEETYAINELEELLADKQISICEVKPLL